jgi:hypothetical protein
MTIRYFATGAVFVPIPLASGYFVKPGPGTVVMSLPPNPTVPADDAHWAQLEDTLPPNDELLASACRHRAPQQWYDEQTGPC